MDVRTLEYNTFTVLRSSAPLLTPSLVACTPASSQLQSGHHFHHHHYPANLHRSVIVTAACVNGADR